MLPSGALAFVADERRIVVTEGGGGWTPLDSFVAALDGLSHLGVGATADSVNRLSVASASALFSHAGSEMRVSVNKASAPASASVLFQDAFAGRAEVGLCGDDDLHLRVNHEGTWGDALVVGSDAVVCVPGGRLKVSALRWASSKP